MERHIPEQCTRLTWRFAKDTLLWQFNTMGCFSCTSSRNQEREGKKSRV